MLYLYLCDARISVRIILYDPTFFYPSAVSIMILCWQ